MNTLSLYFNSDQIKLIITKYQNGFLYFKSDKQIEWLEDIISKYNKFGLNTRCSPACKNFLTRILNDHYTTNSNEDLWNYKGS